MLFLPLITALFGVFLGISSPVYGATQPILQTTTISRTDGSAITWYLQVPPGRVYPLVVLCEGSSSRGNLASVMRLMKEFSPQMLEIGMGVMAIEKYGITADRIDEQAFWEHYTVSQRLQDHKTVIEFLRRNQLSGWNGAFIFIGGSEGGPLVNALTVAYQDQTLATINFAGAGYYGWKEEFWMWLEHMKQRWGPVAWLESLVPQWVMGPYYIPYEREEYDHFVEQIEKNPVADRWLGGMTYKYHADKYTTIDANFTSITTPLFVFVGTHDSLLGSCDAFVAQAREAGVPIEYRRVDGIGHELRNAKIDVVKESIDWLRAKIKGLA